MSEKAANAGGAGEPSKDGTSGASQNDGGGAAKTETPTLEQLLEENRKLKEHNQALFGEKKKTQTELESIRKAQEEAEKKRLEDEGKWKELAEKEKNEKLQLAQQFESKVTRGQVKEALLKAGCVDSDSLLKIFDYKESVKFDGDKNAVKETLDAFVESVKEKSQHLGFFKSNVKQPADIVPGASTTTTTKKGFQEQALEALKGMGAI